MTAPAFKDASFVCTFARMGSGKTTDQAAAFPRALIFSLSRELKSVLSTLGFHPQRIVQVKTLYEVDAGVNELLKARAAKNKEALFHDAVLIDDLTVLAYQTEQALRNGGVQVNGSKLQPKHWDLWVEQRNASLALAFTISEKLKQAGVHLAVNGHQRSARVNNAGKAIRGGLDLPTDLAESFTAGCDLVAMMQQENERLFHPAVFSVGALDPSWATKNRFALPPIVPANTAEILRGAGYTLNRPPGQEKHEEYVETLAGYLLSALGGQAFTKAVLQGALAGPAGELAKLVPNPLHLRWIIRDAVDRAWLRREKHRGVLTEVGVRL